MFTSKQHLINNMGVDPEIAAFFVDRKVPTDNLYWKERLLYVSKGTGYLFIPLLFDLQYRLGVDKKLLLSEEYVGVAEKILDSAAKHEGLLIDHATHIEESKASVEGKVKQQGLYNDLLQYFNDPALKPWQYLGTPSKALNRGDAMLFLFCLIEDEKIAKEVVKQWYALIPSFLLMDDVMDLHEDRARGEENAIADFGTGKEGIEKSLDFLRGNFRALTSVNELLGRYFEQSLNKKLNDPYLQQLLK